MQSLSQLLQTGWNWKLDFNTLCYDILEQNNSTVFSGTKMDVSFRFCSFLWNSDNLEEVRINFLSEICKLLHWNSISSDKKKSLIKTSKLMHQDFQTLSLAENWDSETDCAEWPRDWLWNFVRPRDLKDHSPPLLWAICLMISSSYCTGELVCVE